MLQELFASKSPVKSPSAELAARGPRRVVDVFADNLDNLPPLRAEELSSFADTARDNASAAVEPVVVEPAARKALPTMMQGVIRDGRVEVKGAQKFPEGTLVRIIRQ